MALIVRTGNGVKIVFMMIEYICQKLKSLKTEQEMKRYLESLQTNKATIFLVAKYLFGEEYTRNKRTYTSKNW